VADRKSGEAVFSA